MARRFQFRLTIRRMMIAVLFVAILLGWVVHRPYPMESETLGSLSYLFWSDGRVTQHENGKFPEFRGSSWFLAVDFPDGRTRYYVTFRHPILQ